MSILDYRAFRILANPGGTLDALGLPEWPVASMRASGFDDGITVSSTSAFPMVLSCNALAADSVTSVDEFDWFVSQRTEVSGSEPFVVAKYTPDTDTYSGSISLTLAAWASTEYPDPWDESMARVLFFAVDVYVRRKSDGAIQRLDLLAHVIDAVEAKTDLE
jgi:hypothetical protein